MEQACQWIRAAKNVVAFTGAGISAESGIPTFRGVDGLWRNFKAEQLATPGAFQEDPKRVWEWYDWRRQKIAAAQPNAAHMALKELEDRKPEFTLITQNVDGLHDRAGSRNILKLHGDIWVLRCTACGKRWRDERVPLFELPPRCSCGATARPDVTWFGEGVPTEPYRLAEEAILGAQVFLTIGTAAMVVPASNLISLAKWAGAKIIELNLEDTWISDKIDCSLRGKAAEVLPQLIA
jgi:NAD-dependent deacetylase